MLKREGRCQDVATSRSAIIACLYLVKGPFCSLSAGGCHSEKLAAIEIEVHLF